MDGPFRADERVLLADAKQRRYLVRLAEGGEFHTHAGVVAHDDLIGREEGVTVRSSSGARYTALRPTLTDFVLKMPRGAQVIYPKDLGPLLMLADIHAGVRVLEAGVRSRAPPVTMLRTRPAVGGVRARAPLPAPRPAEREALLVARDGLPL